MDILEYPKPSHEVNYDLVKYLTIGEFKCKCTYTSCNITLVSEKLLLVYKIFRKFWGKPLIISSGFRCLLHNSDIGGVTNSYHTQGFAIDLHPKDAKDLNSLYKMAIVFFDKVILYEDKGFIHCHMLPQEK